MEMTYMELSNAIDAAYEDYRATSFHNMSPKMIAGMMRGGICKVLNSIDRMEDDIRDKAPAIHGRATQSQIANVDRLRNRARMIWTHLNNEVEAAISRAA